MIGLRDRAASAIRWALLSHTARHVIQLGTTITLVRLLAPSDFGLMAMVLVVVGLAQLFHDLGTGDAVIQRRELNDRLLSTVYWFNIGCGVVAAAIVSLLAPAVALFYGEPRVVPMLMALSTSFVICGLSVVPHALIRRRLEFELLARVELWATVCGAVVAIVAAVRGAGVWSLVLQSIAVTLITTIMLWCCCHWHPRLVFRWADLRSVSGFSLNLTGFNVCNHLVRHADYLIIGRVLGSTELGYYTLAYQLMLYPIRNISAVIGRVTIPIYARLQDDHARFRRAFLKVSASIAAITFPMMIGLALASHSVVHAVFGPQWAPVGTLLMILAPVGLLQSLVTTFGAIYRAKGRTGLFLVWGLALSGVTVAAFLVGVRWGVIGVASAYLVVAVLQLYPCMRVPFGLIDLPVREFLLALWRPAACCAAMGVVVAALMAGLTAELSPSTALIAVVTVGFAAYAVLTWTINRRHVVETVRLLLLRPGDGSPAP